MNSVMNNTNNMNSTSLDSYGGRIGDRNSTNIFIQNDRENIRNSPRNSPRNSTDKFDFEKMKDEKMRDEKIKDEKMSKGKLVVVTRSGDRNDRVDRIDRIDRIDRSDGSNIDSIDQLLLLIERMRGTIESIISEREREIERQIALVTVKDQMLSQANLQLMLEGKDGLYQVKLILNVHTSAV